MEWNVDELAERAAAALTPTAQVSGRVQRVPDRRLIRWYATIGLLDPPSARRGRTALYGRRHLLQLVAVKRRQAEGRTIAEIQAELAGATDRTLEAIAVLPENGPAETALAQDAAPRAARPRFWAERAAPPLAAPPGVPTPSEPSAPHPPTPSGVPPRHTPAAGVRRRAPAAGPPPREAAPVAASPQPAVPVHGVRLAAGVTLLLDGGARVPSPADLAEIGGAAQALLSVLRDRDLAPREGNRS